LAQAGAWFMEINDGRLGEATEGLGPSSSAFAVGHGKPLK